MIKLENYEVVGWEHAIRGMRNPMNSWAKSDSTFKETAETEAINYSKNPDGEIETIFVPFDALSIGLNDHDLMMRLRNAGSDHRKYMRQINVYVDITAPLYWWKEFDTYKVGTVANSCSTMHKIHAKEFTLDDFSHEHLIDSSDIIKDKDVKDNLDVLERYQMEGYILANGEHDLMDIEYEDHVEYMSPVDLFEVYIINMLNFYRKKYLKTKDKKYWWQMIQLLPSSYNQLRTVSMNYEVLANIYKSRKNHKLDEWRELCKWIESLPYSEVITGVTEEVDECEVCGV